MPFKTSIERYNRSQNGLGSPSIGAKNQYAPHSTAPHKISLNMNFTTLMAK